jgi:ketosteroid isomerase-like protein
MADPRELAQAYFDSWRAHDFERFRSLLADDVTFKGPLGEASNADECVAGIRGMSKIVTDIDVTVMVADGDDVITWFELHTEDGAVLPTANWSHVEDGRISRIRVAFDPRPLTG